MTRIVVGVDGSPESGRALRRGVEEAHLRNGQVEAIYVFAPPSRTLADTLISVPYGVGAPMGRAISPDAPSHHPPSPNDQAHKDAQRLLKQFVTEALSETKGPAPELRVLAADHPAQALIDETRSADLLVIGTRGLGGFTGMLLGSVAHQCIQHSKCPMLILPPEH